MSLKLFVYGTLKQGKHNNYLLRNQKLLRKGTYNIPYKMYDLGSFPCLIPSDNLHKISGEIYEIDEKTLAATDYLEGYPNFYTRKLEKFNDNHECWVYYIDATEQRFVQTRRSAILSEWN